MALIKVKDVTKSPIFVADSYGVQVNDMICSHFDKGEKVTVSFEGMEMVTASFLTPAIGDLYGKYDEEFIKEHLETTNLTDFGIWYLDWVIRESKKYFADPEGYVKRMDELLEESD